ncbi:hypothetical protein [Caulobacter sp. NIBR1757]|uniref:hypothetical protein n=1 Tax=Caulobacter sp. NIBR1757 TaxID=3016000 RepID=UPI0022F0691E|nr:hypothetical protein [Caulobacter sp. NIBR1757]WGM39147.1 hypothetical protein AMEJIAPC_02061 [Caulobacter sp. NIBR1757]
MPLTTIFRVFAAILALFGMLNFILLVLADPIGRFSPVALGATTSLTDAILLFGVGAGVWVLGQGTGHKAHH